MVQYIFLNDLRIVVVIIDPLVLISNPLNGEINFIILNTYRISLQSHLFQDVSKFRCLGKVFINLSHQHQ